MARRFSVILGTIFCFLFLSVSGFAQPAKETAPAPGPQSPASTEMKSGGVEKKTTVKKTKRTKKVKKTKRIKKSARAKKAGPSKQQ